MESFYGGRQGTPFVLARSFVTEKEMADNFKKGLAYKEVLYDEYVLINNTNRVSNENGRIYKRGRDINNSLGGAIYIGTISGPIGPAGKSPNLKLTTLEDVLNKNQTADGVEGFTQGVYAPNLGLVPGKKPDGTYNDSIKWASCTITLPNGEEKEAYLGFEVPYLVVNYDADSVSPYYNRSNDGSNFTNQNLIDRIDNKEHPFYEHWNIKIPKGIKGDAFKNLRVIPADSSVQDYEGKADDIAHNRKILVYDYYNYDRFENGNPVTVYLGDYNLITDLSFDEDGTISVGYSHNDATVYNKLVKWIKNVSLNSETGHFKIEFNYDEKDGTPTVYETDLSWVKDIHVTEDGIVKVDFSTGETETLSGKIKYIVSVILSEDGSFNIIYNDGSEKSFSKQVKWIDNISLTEEGLFTVHYNNGMPDYTTNLKWVKDIQVKDNGDIDFFYNDNSTHTYEKYLKTVSNISLDSEDESGLPGSGTQKLKIQYNTGLSELIGDPINYIMETAFTSDYHFIVYYSDPALRSKIVSEGLAYPKEYKGKTDWLDLGSIKDEDGILIGLNISKSAIGQIPEIDYLNQNYPDGLQGELKGKIVTVGDSNDSKIFYAFNYDLDEDNNYLGWYQLGELSTVNLSEIFMVESENDPNIESKKDKLLTNGLWFVIEE